MTIIADPQEILSLARNFMECRVLLTGAELDIFTHLAEPASSKMLAEKQGWHERPLTVVLDALCAMGLLDKKDGQYQTRPDLLAFLGADSSQSVLPMVKHAATIWTNWLNLTRIVTETGIANTKPARFQGEDQKAFIQAMHVVGRLHAPAIVKAIQPGPARRLLDIGGASGTYTIAFLKESPQLSATIFDLPDVVDMARVKIAESGLKDRVEFVSGNFYTDPLPTGYDLALLSAIIHQNSPDQNLALFKKIATALMPQGRLVIRDHVMEEDRTAPQSGAIFAINMLVVTPGGGTYTFEEIKAGLVQAGFKNIRVVQEKDHMMGLIEAFCP